jgi:hypothetical protein
VRGELGFYIPEDAIPHSDRRENLKSYMLLFIRNQTKRRVKFQISNFRELQDNYGFIERPLF